MNCPVCDVPFIIVERNNIEVDFCPECEGFWLDGGELELLNEILGLNAEFQNPLTLPSVKSTEKIHRCPKCQIQMRKVNLNGVILDVCPDGDGVWFDSGELSKVLNANKDNHEVINFLGEIFKK